MIVMYSAVLFAASYLAVCSVATCQPDWLYFISPIFFLTLYDLVRAILKIKGRYRTLHLFTAILTFFGMFFGMLALFQVPSGNWWKVLQNGVFVPLYIILIYRNGVTYRTGLEVDAKVQKWKDEMAARELKWAEPHN